MAICLGLRVVVAMNKGWCAAVLLGAAMLGAHAGSDVAAVDVSERDWFTVAGDARQPDAETVQVDPVALRSEGDARTMRVRVSRAQERRNWEDVPYRSYESSVRINCRTRRAHYVQASFYSQPLWQGNPGHVADYQQNPQPMLFKGMNPNPTERIIRAACSQPAGSVIRK